MPGLTIRVELPEAPSPAAVSLEPAAVPGSVATLVEGDNLEVLRALHASHAGQVTLAYLDPPFFTGRRHDRVVRRRDPEGGAVVRSSVPAFDDRWADLPEYLGALAGRVVAARELLAANGCLVLHVDPRTSHYAKVVLDHVFGPAAFASEIVWRYRRWPSRTRNFQRVHDVLLRYVKDPRVEPRFRQLYEPLAASTRATWGEQRQRAVVGEDGRRRRSSVTEASSPGAPLGDVWEIGIVAPIARERTGYPTQKPEGLLERLVSACTEPGDLVLDPYLGSGTTAAVAVRTGRRILGIDANPDALAITRGRLGGLGVEPVSVAARVAARAPARARARAGRARPAAA